MIEGDCTVELKPDGPDQLNVEPFTVDVPMRLSVPPSQKGPLLEAVTTGTGFTITIVVSAVVHPFKLAVTI